MFIIDTKLKQREKEGNLIKVAVIGCGEMGKGLINQIVNYTSGMHVVFAYNRTLNKAKDAIKYAGIDNFIEIIGDDSCDKYIKEGQTILTNNIDLLFSAKEIDCVVEMTGQIGFGAKVILDSFKSGKHVVSFNAELDSTLGYIINEKAKENGVRYTLGDGDQPGVTMKLFRQVKAMGFKPLLCGNIKGLQDKYRTPATQESFAKVWGISPLMATCFADGTKISFEQACIANATNMSVAKRGMIGFETQKHVDDLAKEMDIDMLLENGGIVDYALGAKPGPGIFVFATIDDDFSKHYLKYAKLGDGPLYSFYIPYHLLFFELVFSIARLIDYNDQTLNAEFGIRVEVGTFAKQDLKTGTKLDGIGGFHSYGMCENHPVFVSEKLLPIGLSENAILKKNIPKDMPITFEDVYFVQDCLEYILYKEQSDLLLNNFEN